MVQHKYVLWPNDALSLRKRPTPKTYVPGIILQEEVVVFIAWAYHKKFGLGMDGDRFVID